MSADVRRIDWVETAGELGALLRELADIQTLEPRYNRRLQSLSNGCTVRLCEETGAVDIAAIDETDAADLTQCFGVFRSRKDARKALIDIARAKRLCLKVLGLESDEAAILAEGSCLAFQNGACKGACIGREPLALHSVRVQMALSSLKLKPWPFPGRVALIERGAMGTADLHVLDHWTYLGTARSEEDLAALAARRSDAAFDAQVYKILVRHFAHHPRLEWQDLEMRSRLGNADVH